MIIEKRDYYNHGRIEAGESLTPYDLESAMNRPGYYLTVERKNGTLSVKRG